MPPARSKRDAPPPEEPVVPPDVSSPLDEPDRTPADWPIADQVSDFQRALRGDPVDLADQNTKRRVRSREFKSGSPVFPVLPGEDQASWRVTKIDPASAKALECGHIEANCTMMQFIERFYDSMPKDGELPVTFGLAPIAQNGTKLSDEYHSIAIDATHVDLREARARRGRAAPVTVGGITLSGSGEAVALSFLQQQLQELKDEARRVREAAEAERRDLADQRLALAADRGALAQSAAMDLGQGYRTLHEATQEVFKASATKTGDAMTEVLASQRALAEADRISRQEAAAAERDRLRLENEARLEQMKSEHLLALQREQMRVDAENRRLEADRERMYQERQDAEQRRREEKEAEAQRRRDEKEADREWAEREENRRLAHEAKMEQMRIDEQARRDRADAEDRQRRDAALERDRAAQQQHFELTMQMLHRREEAASSPLNFVKDIVEQLGGPTALMAIAAKGVDLLKDVMSGGETKGLMATALEQVGEIGKAFIERLPAESDAPEDDDEDDEEARAIAEEARRREARRRRAAAMAAEKAEKIEKTDPKALPGGDTVPVGVGGLFRKPPEKEPVAVAEAPAAQPEATAASQAPAPNPDAEKVAQRAACLDFLSALEGLPSERWGSVVPEDATTLQRIVARVSAVGLRKVVTEAGFPDTMIEEVRMLMVKHFPFPGGVVSVEK